MAELSYAVNPEKARRCLQNRSTQGQGKSQHCERWIVGRAARSQNFIKRTRRACAPVRPEAVVKCLFLDLQRPDEEIQELIVVIHLSVRQGLQKIFLSKILID